MNSSAESISESADHKIIWDIDSFHKKHLALDFVKNINELLCVFSSTLRHIYGEYSIETLSAIDTKIVVVPSTYSMERYTDIGEDAILPTGIHVYPGWFFKKDVPYLMTFPVKSGDTQYRSRPLSPMHCFEIIERTIIKDNFLPIIKNGDLREFNQQAPYLHLHRININKIDNLSQFDLQQLKLLILDKRKLFLTRKR
ncbi:hypothetical protein TDB9533_01136 [Thalassocella blandensis]|nr:hypothetical protein TDB9533_01136 [Thalassocella blandensis]